MRYHGGGIFYVTLLESEWFLEIFGAISYDEFPLLTQYLCFNSDTFYYMPE